MKWIKLKRYRIKVSGYKTRIPMKGFVSAEEHTHFLHSLLTNNIKGLRQGSFNYNLQLKPNGQPVTDFFVYRRSDHYLLDTERSAKEVIEEFERIKLSLKVFFEDLTSNTEHIFVFGEGASDFVGKELGDIPAEGKFLEKGNFIVAKNSLRLGLEGYDFIGDLKAVRFPEEGKIEEFQYEDIRIENCIPRIGKELREGFFPMEAGILSCAVDMNKGCYIGQETVARIYYKGRIPRILVKFEVLGKVKEGDSIEKESKKVGIVTSVNSTGNLALGYLLKEISKRFTEFRVSQGKLKLISFCKDEGESKKST